MPENFRPARDDDETTSDPLRELLDQASQPAPLTRRELREAAARAAAEEAHAPPARRVYDAEPASTADPLEAMASFGAPVSARAAAEATPVQANIAPGEPKVTPREANILDDIIESSSPARARADAGSGAPPKKKRRRGCLTAFIIVLLILGGAAAAGVWVWDNYGERIREELGWAEPKDWEPGQPGDPVLVTIRSGDTGSSISTTLFEAGVTKTDRAFYNMMVKDQLSVNFFPGVYELYARLSSVEALELLTDPSRKLENSVLLREGLTMSRSLEIISEALGIDLYDLQEAVSDPSVYGVDAVSLEGWIFPAMYSFDPGTTAEEVIARMVARTRESLAKAGVSEDEAHEILTIASIIQREARFDVDFFKVSRVIQNRLMPGNKETFGLLQMDSTAKYGVGELDSGSLDVSLRAQRDDNPWNTYRYPGLPIGPIANSGDLAIDAAKHPVEGTWLYFVTTDPKAGMTIFTDTYRQHLVQVDVWRKWCRANPDYPC